MHTKNIAVFSLMGVLFIHLDCLSVSCRILEISAVDVCLLSNMMDIDGNFTCGAQRAIK